jgi:iron complex outermembrane receptor protein
MRIRNLSGLVSLASLLATMPATAAEPTPVNGQITDSVTVTATREESRRFDMPESTGVLGGALISEVRPVHPSDIMERIAGVHQVWLAGDHHTTVIRQPINFNPVYLYLENGVPTRSTGFFETNALFDVNMPQASRVEITKGPGTALYGSDAIGGIINVMTPLPTAEPDGYMSIEGSTRSYYRLLASASGTKGKHGLRADINLAYDEGWRDLTGSDRQLANLTWTINPSDRVSIQNVLLLAKVDQDSSGSNLGRDDWQNNPTLNKAPIAARNTESVRFHSLIDIKIDDETLLSFTPYFRYNRVQLLPAFALGFDPHQYDVNGQSVGVLTKYRKDISPSFRLIFGVDLDYSWGHRDDQSIDPMRVDGIYESFTIIDTVYDFNVKAITISPYVHGEWQMTERLRLTAGLRFDYADYDYTNNLSIVLDPTALHNRPADQKVDFDHFTPKVGLTYDFTDKLNGFVSYRQGFRTPTVTQLFRPGRSADSTALDPVKSESFEVGLRGMVGERISFELAGYYMTNRDDILVFTDDETGGRQIENSGKTRHKGIEFSVDIEVTPVLLFSAAYAYNHHSFIEWMPRSGTDLSGHKINRAPKDVANVRLAWRPDWLNGGRLEVEYQHLGSYYLDDNNTHTYGGHDLLHLRGNIKIDNGLDIYLRLHNLFNSRYATNGRFNGFVGEELKPGQPRTLYAGVTANF